MWCMHTPHLTDVTYINKNACNSLYTVDSTSLEKDPNDCTTMLNDGEND